MRIVKRQYDFAGRLVYDELDRLRRASAPNDWGDANYTYDALTT